MKIWKMLGCLVLLCVIICGCVVIGTEAETGDGEGNVQENGTGEGTPDTLVSESGGEQEPTVGSVVVTPTYSEGLRFRSNGDGTCALAGIGSCTSSCILIPPTSPAGDTVTEILPYAL